MAIYSLNVRVGLLWGVFYLTKMWPKEMMKGFEVLFDSQYTQGVRKLRTALFLKLFFSFEMSTLIFVFRNLIF